MPDQKQTHVYLALVIIAWIVAFTFNWGAFLGLQIIGIPLMFIGSKLWLWTRNDAIWRANRQAYILRVSMLSAVRVGWRIVEVFLVLQLHVSLRRCDNVLGHFNDLKDFASFFALWLLLKPRESA